ncbi:hypothetical protein H696_00623 [Fonticula alba]|uniref:CTLH domain-containing protein n=1 Tax=Fonticula alba TaxID=691883 RepID=A0A058ZHU4_FONAL|nr:hypothetical protein H696_00623 [Fonticula alba]KCV73077.1 hypothetical protein H696_00623 [Fonticula alba]|eukprot:XP_009492778.1 hypothetical protein H696_00623 [Fonticula alba]
MTIANTGNLALKHFLLDASIDLDQLVLNYLISEGHQEVAELFCREVGLQLNIDLSYLSQQKRISEAILRGDIAAAFALIGDMKMDLFSRCPRLLFQLQLQQLVELIRAGHTVAALRFAEVDLAPRACSNSHFLADLEQVLLLLIFDNPADSPSSHYLDLARRQGLVELLRDSVQSLTLGPRLSQLPVLIRYMFLAQDVLAAGGLKFPSYLDLIDDSFSCQFFSFPHEVAGGAGGGGGVAGVAAFPPSSSGGPSRSPRQLAATMHPSRHAASPPAGTSGPAAAAMVGGGVPGGTPGAAYLPSSGAGGGLP